MKQKKIALFGGGPACLLAAIELNKTYQVHIFEKGKTIGRKFLVAGKGGFNLTNKLVGKQLTDVYSNHSIIHNALNKFDSNAVQNWFAKLGVETYIGSSGRVFPNKGIKPIEILEKIKSKLLDKGVEFHFNHEFIGFNKKKEPIVLTNNQQQIIKADHYIFGLGGGSWSVTGANDKWLNYFNEIKIETKPFQASNCGLNIDWDTNFIEQFQGIPLKNISIKTKDKKIKGEALITHYGLEGNAIYPIASAIRNELNSLGDKKNKKTVLEIDFKPNNTEKELVAKIKNNTLKPKNYGYTFNCDKVSIQLIKNSLTKAEYLNPIRFAKQVKTVPIIVTSLRPIEEAISTVGGIRMDQINENFELIKHPNISIIGEMLDWDAPTGGFLLQGCFSTAYAVAHKINSK